MTAPISVTNIENSITIEGIENAVSNLDYSNPKILKSRYLQAVKSHYTSQEALNSINTINSDHLIKKIWNINDDPSAIKSKRKNLSSIRSTINSDLRKLYKKGKNPEGIIIGINNTFEMSDDAKNELLDSFSNSLKADSGIDLNKISDVLNLINTFLSDYKSKTEDSEDSESEDMLNKIKKILGQINDEIIDEKQKEIENNDLEEIEDIVEEIEDDSEFDKINDEEALEEIDDDEEFDEVDDKDTLEEIIDEEEFDEVDDDETLEEIDDDEEFDEVDDDEALEEIADDEEFDEVDDEDTLEEIADDEEFDEVNDEDTLEEIADDEEFDEVDDDDEALEEIGDDEDFVDIDDIQSGIPSDSLDDDISESEDNRILAEQFTNFLGAMDRYYNKYLLIPPGNYLVGSPEPEKYEEKEHIVILPDFFIGKFPITNSLFEVFVHKTGHRTTAEKLGHGTVYSGRFKKTIDKQSGQISTEWNSTHNYKIIKGACWYQPTGPGSSIHNKLHHPVVQISLDDALAFSAWIGKKLPGEEEWEAAARTKEGYKYPWGNDWKENSCNIEDSGLSETTPVDNYLDFINNYDIADLIGNIMEWTTNEIQPPFKTKSKSKFFIAKGGSWVSGKNISLWSRFIFKSEYSSNILGFRCIAE